MQIQREIDKEGGEERAKGRKRGEGRERGITGHIAFERHLKQVQRKCLRSWHEGSQGWSEGSEGIPLRVSLK